MSQPDFQNPGGGVAPKDGWPRNTLKAIERTSYAADYSFFTAKEHKWGSVLRASGPWYRGTQLVTVQQLVSTLKLR